MTEKEKRERKNMEFMINQDDYMHAFRKNIDICAKKLKMTLKEIAEKANIPFATLNSFLYGTQKDCKLSTAIKLARAFDVTVDELVGGGTFTKEEQILMRQIRGMSERDKYLVKWFVDFQYQSANGIPKERTISAMIPETREESAGMCFTKVFEKIDITDCSDEIRSKVFVGIKMIDDHYMPVYTPYDILLVANDRVARVNETSVIMYCQKLYLVKRISENNKVSYVSIRDSRFCVSEKEVDCILGYVAGVYYSTKENNYQNDELIKS